MGWAAGIGRGSSTGEGGDGDEGVTIGPFRDPHPAKVIDTEKQAVSRSSRKTLVIGIKESTIYLSVSVETKPVQREEAQFAGPDGH